MFVSLKDVTQSAELLGAVARVPIDIPLGRLTQDTVKLEFTRSDVDRDFVYWVLRAPEYREYCRAHSTGTTNLGLPREDFLAFELPELTPERSVLVRILEIVDISIDLNRRMSETLEETARALFKSWFVDFDPVRAKAEGRRPFGMDAATAALFPDRFETSDLGDVPAGWQVGPVTTLQSKNKYACVAGPFGSNLTSRDYVASGIPVIRGGNLTSGSIWLHDRDFVFVSDSKAEQLSGNMAYPGDVVFTQRGTLGQVALVPPDTDFSRFVISQSQMKLTVDPLVGSAAYVALYFGQSRIIDYIVANGQQAGVPHVNLGFLRTFKILLPPPAILRAFDNQVSPLLGATRARELEARTLAELRDYLLPRLLSGEIRVKEAEHLLEQTP